jgi:hypothetical protein
VADEVIGPKLIDRFESVLFEDLGDDAPHEILASAFGPNQWDSRSSST